MLGSRLIRAELPGIDPRDVEVSLHDGRLTIKAERTEKHEENRHSEFTYGSFVRTVALPAGAQVTVPLGELKETVCRIDVASGE
ncbi:Hsp20/alpha crystallin family protein [Nocardia terpenica]|uniref:Hsp20 family protein n=1 Tax=Nocardia terpenica TaxID=455432 RepID=A0A6G9Z0H4_9NOCA|nr:Hsp20 family protein [Nocardia terpenica]